MRPIRVVRLVVAVTAAVVVGVHKYQKAHGAQPQGPATTASVVR